MPPVFGKERKISAQIIKDKRSALRGVYLFIFCFDPTGEMVKKGLTFLIAAMLMAMISGFLACASGEAPKRERLRVATTTSLYDTGLWGYLEPMFEEKYGVELDIIYGGTGKALEWGRRGDVDIITIHSKACEEQFIAQGYGIKRHPIAYNYFLIIGPQGDPAAIKGLSPGDAFKRLMEKGKANPQEIKFISRGDESGTHTKEKEIWQSAGYSYDETRESGDWYIEAGGGMGATLVLANEKSGYTLTDLGTFLAFKGKLNLVPLVDKGDILLNVYSAIAINPEKHKEVNIEMANKLIDFLTSEEVQELIGTYGVKEYGRQLFIPCAGQGL